MARVLTVSRVVVPRQHQEEYIQTVHALAILTEARQQHLWVFRHSKEPDTFVEFSESPSLASHRSRASRTDLELRLERRLRELGRYADDAWDLWEAVPPPPEPAQPEWEDEGEETDQ